MIPPTPNRKTFKFVSPPGAERGETDGETWGEGEDPAEDAEHAQDVTLSKRFKRFTTIKLKTCKIVGTFEQG